MKKKMTKKMTKNEVCPVCQRPMPYKSEGSMLPCSIYHKRCVECDWPVAEKMLDINGVCGICTKSKGGT